MEVMSELHLFFQMLSNNSFIISDITVIFVYITINGLLQGQDVVNETWDCAWKLLFWYIPCQATVYFGVGEQNTDVCKIFKSMKELFNILLFEFIYFANWMPTSDVTSYLKVKIFVGFMS